MGHRNDKSYLFLPNHRCKRRSFARVDLRAAMFSIPSCAWVDSYGRLFHDLSRKHAGKHMSRIMRETSWDVEQTKNRLAFLPKRRFKYNVSNTSCHVYNKDGDINPVSYRTEKKIYSFLTMCKERHVSCKQPTRDFFFRVVISGLCIYLVRPWANFRRWHQMMVRRIKRSC